MDIQNTDQTSTQLQLDYDLLDHFFHWDMIIQSIAEHQGIKNQNQGKQFFQADYVNQIKHMSFNHTGELKLLQKTSCKKSSLLKIKLSVLYLITLCLKTQLIKWLERNEMKTDQLMKKLDAKLYFINQKFFQTTQISVIFEKLDQFFEDIQNLIQKYNQIESIFAMNVKFLERYYQMINKGDCSKAQIEEVIQQLKSRLVNFEMVEKITVLKKKRLFQMFKVLQTCDSKKNNKISNSQGEFKISLDNLDKTTLKKIQNILIKKSID